MRGVLYSFPVKLVFLTGALVAAVILVKARGFLDFVMGTLNASSGSI